MMASREEFIDWLRQELEERGWSQSELARRGGITRSQISRLMLGERNPGIDTCQAIARAFRIPVEDVLRRAGVLPRNRRIPSTLEELQLHFLNLTPEDQQRLLVIARAFHQEASPQK